MFLCFSFLSVVCFYSYVILFYVQFLDFLINQRELVKTKKKANEHENNLIEIFGENHPIDINKYTNYVHAPQCGAIATFNENTHDTFEGKTDIELRYEVYVPMYIRCLSSICSSARSKWNLNSIAVTHRLGPISVGETSVFVAISSIHRVDALDACKFVIDELKASVLIRKKEVYSNGEV